jgi:hypothetical protein
LCKKCKYVTPNYEYDELQGVSEDKSRKAQISLQSKRYVNLILAAEQERNTIKNKEDHSDETESISKKDYSDITESSTNEDLSDITESKEDYSDITESSSKEDLSNKTESSSSETFFGDGNNIKDVKVDRGKRDKQQKIDKNRSLQHSPAPVKTSNISTDLKKNSHSAYLDNLQDDLGTTPHSNNTNEDKIVKQQKGNGANNNMVQTNNESKQDSHEEESLVIVSTVRNNDYLSRSNVIKVLRVLSEPQCSISMEYSLTFEEKNVEIIDVMNDLSLSSCKLVPTRFVPNTNFVQHGTLYVKGTVIKKITYTPILNEESLSKASKIFHVNIPFQFATEISFPKQRHPKLSLTNKQSFQFTTSDDQTFHSSEALHRSRIVYNEPLQFELVSALFHELSFSPTSNEEASETNTFNASCSVDITIGILQKQNARVMMEFDQE